MMKSFLRFVELQGLQAAGKTTLAREWLKQYPNVARVNRDDLRSMLFGDSYRLQQEPVVVACEKACAVSCVKAGYNVVIDDTNLAGSPTWKDLAADLGIKHTVQKLRISVEEAITRDSNREHPVGPIAIRATAARAKTLTGLLEHREMFMNKELWLKIAEQIIKGEDVARTAVQGLAIKSFNDSGHRIIAIEQNPNTNSKWGKLARNGHKVVQFKDAETNKYLGVSVDGVFERY